ncbi:hypothetical protein [Vibrio crassostreae]|uniref:hypothetical protein n=1 Tax=Vibrio crassostreae TaxID=246167 RepID=UPI001B30505F|nr:hypothetical protein [Vibrio crassostreae]
MITDKEALKAESIKYLGSYADKKVANKYLLFKSPRKGLKKAKAVSVTIRIPLTDSEKKHKTKTIEHSGQSTHAFLNQVRLERDDLFKVVFGIKYSEKNLASVTPERKKQESASGVDGVGVVKNTLKFKVNYTLGSTEKVAYFSVLTIGSEDLAFIKACRFNDEINGRPIKGNASYLKLKKSGIFPELSDPNFWECVEELERIKKTNKIDKAGIEVVAKVGMIGFFANFYNPELERQYRHFFNASTIGENEAFLEACQAKDEIEGLEIQSDKAYLKLKPKLIFKSVL